MILHAFNQLETVLSLFILYVRFLGGSMKLMESTGTLKTAKRQEPLAND
jgi:hypothetical protein